MTRAGVVTPLFPARETARDAAAGPQASDEATPKPNAVEASLHFAAGGGRTVLAHQRAPYPFHLTRPFYLDAARPDLATLYLQSASGGLYRGDRLELTIATEAGAAAHVTTQASTIVHDTRGLHAVQRTRLAAKADSFLAYTPDPLVLFPNAVIESNTEIALMPGANMIVCEGMARHDPQARARPFALYKASTIVRDETGRVLLADRGAVKGSEIGGRASPLGPYQATGSFLVLGPRAQHCDPEALEEQLAQAGCLAGFGRLPFSIGIGGRVLAPDGGTLARGLEAAFALAFEALVGAPPARRRK